MRILISTVIALASCSSAPPPAAPSSLDPRAEFEASPRERETQPSEPQRDPESGGWSEADRANMRRFCQPWSDQDCLEQIAANDLWGWLHGSDSMIGRSVRAGDTFPEFEPLRGRPYPQPVTTARCIAKPASDPGSFAEYDSDNAAHRMMCLLSSFQDELDAARSSGSKLWTRVAEAARKAQEETAAAQALSERLGGFKLLKGPKPGEQFRAGAWGFEVETISALNDGTLTATYLVENLSRDPQVIPTATVYVLDARRVKHNPDRLGDFSRRFLGGGQVFEQLTPNTRIKLTATFTLPVEVLAGDFAIVFQDPASPSKSVRVELSGKELDFSGDTK